MLSSWQLWYPEWGFFCPLSLTSLIYNFCMMAKIALSWRRLPALSSLRRQPGERECILALKEHFLGPARWLSSCQRWHPEFHLWSPHGGVEAVLLPSVWVWVYSAVAGVSSSLSLFTMNCTGVNGYRKRHGSLQKFRWIWRWLASSMQMEIAGGIKWYFMHHLHIMHLSKVHTAWALLWACSFSWMKSR